MADIGLGSFYPKYTNLGVVALAYSCIAPLVLGFATVGFGFLYLAFRYNVLFTLGTQVDTEGRAYARALQQLTVGVYLSEICLIGVSAIESSGCFISLGPLILMVIFLLATVIWHFHLRSAMHKHTTSLPSDLLAEEYRGQDLEQVMDVEKSTVPSTEQMARDHYQVLRSADPTPPPSGIMSKIKAFLMPSRFASAAVISKYILSPDLAQPVRPYSQQEREKDCLHPAVVA